MSAAGYKVSANYVEASVLSRPALLTHDEAGNCLIICRHCGKVTQVQCKEAATSPCDEQGCTDTDNCDEICIHQRIYSQAQMDEKVAQAREDENKRIVKILEEYRFGLDYPDCPPGDAIKKLVESLRTGGEPR